jgi:hypothetical protein
LPQRPPRPAYVREGQALGVARLNQALVAVVLVLGFLLASFAVRNTDFWMSLATGRALFQGEYRPWTGQDPFSYTAEGTYWVNHAWVFDLAVYKVYEVLGAPALVVLKGLLVAALAWVLLQIRRPGEDAWLPAACTGLALVALSPRLLLQPVVVSYLFLALTLWLLHRSARDEDAPAVPGAGRRLDALWLLPPLFVLWVNMDQWFLLGLLAVALFLLGELLQRLVPFGAGEPRPAGGRARLRRLALVLAVSVAACLVNPHLHRAFALPPELSPAQPTPLLAQDREFRFYFISPLTQDYWQNPNIGRNLAGLAFYPLVLLGLVSFGLNRGGWRWWRALLWLGFFLLAAYRWHAVAFFAVVAGPITALNFQDVAARRRAAPTGAEPREDGGRAWVAAVKVAVVLAVLLLALKLGTRTTFYTDKLAKLGWPEPPVVFLLFVGFVVGAVCYGLGPTLAYFDRVFTNWSLGGRVLTLLAGALLLVCAWPGWLAAALRRPESGAAREPESARRVAWAVEPDPSLRRLAEWIGKARQTGKLDRGFATQPQVASYCAWYCPEERGFFDHRFGQFAESAATYLGVRDTLTGAEPDAGPAGGASTGRERQRRDCFRRYHINHVIVGANDPARAWQWSRALEEDPGEWTLLYLDGHNTVFGWKDPDREDAPDPWAALAYRPTRRAFGPPSEVEQAPEQGPHDPVRVPAWATYVVAPPRRDLSGDEALLHLLRFETASSRWRDDTGRAWEAVNAARVVSGVAPNAGSVGGPALLAYRACLAGFFLPADSAPADRPPSQMAEQLAAADQGAFAFWRDDGPPAQAMLALRAARRAVAANPQDAQAYIRLEQAYSDLRYKTQERGWCRELPELALLRHIQMVTALERALTIQPDLAGPHLELADLYRQCHTPQNPEWGYIDLELKHLRAALGQIQRAGPQPGESQEEFDERVKRLDRQATDLQKTVQKHLNQFEVSSSSMRVLQKAAKALSLGLAEQALNALLESDVLEFGQQGAQLQFQLLLTCGRVEEARQLLTDDLKDNLGTAVVGLGTPVSAYEWYRTLLAAADGSYADADQQLQKLVEEKDPRTVLAARLQSLKGKDHANDSDAAFASRYVGEALMETPQEKPVAWLAVNHILRLTELQALFSFGGELQQQAQLLALRGLLAVEAGKTDEAEALFRQAMGISLPPARCAPYLSVLGAGSPLGAAALTVPGILEGAGPVIDFRGRPVVVTYVRVMEQVAAGKE